jgi:hypothetical protein
MTEKLVPLAAAGLIVVVLTGTFIAQRAMVWRAASLHTRASAMPTRVAVVAAPIAPVPTQRPLVHVTNPFDKTEVFEFPAETTESQAREAMAELLLQRARDRFAQGLILGHAGFRHRSRGAVREKPEILVACRSQSCL